MKKFNMLYEKTMNDLSEREGSFTEMLEKDGNALLNKAYECTSVAEMSDLLKKACAEREINGEVKPLDTPWTRKFFWNLDKMNSLVKAQSYLTDAWLKGKGQGVIGSRKLCW